MRCITLVWASWRGLLAVLLLCGAMPGRGQASEIPAMCLAQCGASSRDLRVSPPPVQACLIRCRAGAEFNRGMRNQPQTQQLPRSRGVVPAAATVATIGTGTAVAAARPVGRERWGAIYAAMPPNPAIGMSQGQADRLLAHAQAESQCTSRGRAQCRMVTEFSSGCAAAAQATRIMGLVATDDPSTYSATHVAAGSGPTRQDAERAALAACSDRDRSARCQIVASACAG